ncbi:glycoside hydrolase family 99-like domain-containing protein [[Clostridium] fimetarium]|uniref:Glycosyltransferase WbsX n=1 Tax=[Clostridium] fimetarium TaxID=99656 RepID=A0A1I0P4B5_9FIRM|nr:glycoside hydrolase family 99-like domain-containing protein [[Clostridium] fimetarium]SEW09195.1 Glycosyltransferase WbsX [[Clostridium] fimetarium]
MQILAMYLPQFHNVEENNLWWGEGFTEWTTVKGSKPLFKEHNQPKVPLDQNYYNLLDKETMKWQAELMKQYEVDGICMYHYWFKNGRQILEKPAENLLKWKDIDMPFCFSWANETWARSWSNIREKNVWANTFECKEIKIENGILLEQKYGTEEDWKKHFEYLLPFFQDERYIKVDGKPLFLIYQSSLISCIKEMIEFWRKLSKEAGFPGIYIVGANCNGPAEKVVDATLYMEPGRSKELFKQQSGNSVYEIDYETIWNKILNTRKPTLKTYLGAFVGYDDTPRRGVEGTVITGTTPQKFAHYLTELMAQNTAWGNELVFLNAWNEWGEGMYLEPDQKHEYEYLEAIPYAKKNYEHRVVDYKKNIYDTETYDKKEFFRIQERSDKFEHYLNLLDDWMKLRESRIYLTEFLENAGFNNIGIYGLGTMGRHFLKEVLESQIKVSYIVDQQRDKLHADIPVYLPDEQLPNVDAIVVTSTFYYAEIVELLSEKGVKNIISLETIIKECG